LTEVQSHGISVEDYNDALQLEVREV